MVGRRGRRDEGTEDEEEEEEEGRIKTFIRRKGNESEAMEGGGGDAVTEVFSTTNTALKQEF